MEKGAESRNPQITVEVEVFKNFTSFVLNKV